MEGADAELAAAGGFTVPAALACCCAAISSWYFGFCSAVSIAMIFCRISAVTFSRAAGRSSSLMSRMAMNLGRSSALIASSLVCCSALSCNSATRRSRCAAMPPPPPAAPGPCCATASDSQAQPLASPDVPAGGVAAGKGAGSIPAIFIRNAALATLSTFSRASVITRTFAVIPGSNRPPLFENPITAV